MRLAKTTMAAVLALSLLPAPAAAGDGLTALYRADGIPLDPNDPAWKEVPAVELALDPQTVTEPMQQEAAVTAVRVQALTNGTEIGFRLSWKDPTDDRFHLIAEFSDAVAVMVPYRPSDEVPVTMGGPGDRVLILHWAAFRQENIDNGYADLPKIYPNYAYDWYPHAKPPYRYPQDWRNQYALAYIGGEKLYRKNTLPTPVREVVAEGFGSSTWKDVQRAEGRGVRSEDGWTVVIRRRFVEENTSNPDWGPGKDTFFTVAVWDGGSGDRGARKSLSYAWTPLHIAAEGGK